MRQFIGTCILKLAILILGGRNIKIEFTLKKDS